MFDLAIIYLEKILHLYTRFHREMQSTGICNVRARVSFSRYESLGLAYPITLIKNTFTY